MFSKRLFGAAAMSAVLLPIVACGEDNPLTSAASDLCCTEFKVGADLSGADFGVDASIAGQFNVLAQTASDFSGTASAMLTDVTNACKSIAQDLGVSDADAEGAQAMSPDKQVGEWCRLAVAQLKASGAVSGSLNISPPSISCEASVNAKADCQAKCSGSAECNVEANPPKCTGGGTMQLSCEGSCKASAEAPSFSCKGSCSVAAKGTCTAQGGVDCQGKCEGTCEGSTDAGGNCQGTCKGTCSAVKPEAKCEGTFEGECKGECTATPGSAKVECSAGCQGKATPLKCEGGKLEGGCTVDAKCDANCDASVQAKADCNVKPLQITATGQAQADLKIDAAIATLQVNLPKLILAVKARGEAMGNIAASFAGAATADVVADPGKLGVKGSACALAIVGVLSSAAGNAKASIEAGASVTGQVGL